MHFMRVFHFSTNPWFKKNLNGGSCQLNKWINYKKTNYRLNLSCCSSSQGHRISWYIKKFLSKFSDKTFCNMRKKRKCGKVSSCTTISRKITFYVKNDWFWLFLVWWWFSGWIFVVNNFFIHLYKKLLNSLSICEFN